jgi:Anthrone oxygenase
LVLMAVALVITLAVNVPIDRQIQSWTTAALAPDWQGIRDRWEFYHGLRTLVSLVALACLFAGALHRLAQRGGAPGPARRAPRDVAVYSRVTARTGDLDKCAVSDRTLLAGLTQLLRAWTFGRSALERHSRTTMTWSLLPFATS